MASLHTVGLDRVKVVPYLIVQIQREPSDQLMNEWKILLSRIGLELGMCIDTGLYFYFYLLRLDTKGNPKKDLKKFQSHIQGVFL